MEPSRVNCFAAQLRAKPEFVMLCRQWRQQQDNWRSVCKYILPAANIEAARISTQRRGHRSSVYTINIRNTSRTERRRLGEHNCGERCVNNWGSEQTALQSRHPRVCRPTPHTHSLYAMLKSITRPKHQRYTVRKLCRGISVARMQRSGFKVYGFWGRSYTIASDQYLSINMYYLKRQRKKITTKNIMRTKKN